MKPVIGIVILRIIPESPGVQRQFVSTPSVIADSSSGGIPVLLPITDICPSMDELSFCDGFLFLRRKRTSLPLFLAKILCRGIGATDLATDIFHLSMIRSVLSYNRPLLAICRGMQILNAALGGSIYQTCHLPKSLASVIFSRHSMK